MHFLETYALISGSKINKCFIEEEIIELPKNQYITFHPVCSKGTTRQYDHWDRVIDLLISHNFNYDIIQIGESSDSKYNNINHEYLGKTNYHSLAYLIKNASLHVGYDSLPIHLASHYDIPIVGIYARYAENSGPYFSSPNKTIILESDFTKIKPVYRDNDPYKLINNITPDSIYHAIINLIRMQYHEKNMD